jgi:L-rhamnose mutarotase
LAAQDPILRCQSSLYFGRSAALLPTKSARKNPADRTGLDFFREVCMKRVAFLLKVHPERIEEYKLRHKTVWPEMLAALERTGWHHYSLFMREDGLLVGYFETPESLKAAQEGMAKEEINAKWQASMAPFFESLGDLQPDEGMLELEEIFHLE